MVKIVRIPGMTYITQATVIVVWREEFNLPDTMPENYAEESVSKLVNRCSDPTGKIDIEF
jgi:hypothetical protein